LRIGGGKLLGFCEGFEIPSEAVVRCPLFRRRFFVGDMELGLLRSQREQAPSPRVGVRSQVIGRLDGRGILGIASRLAPTVFGGVLKL
jgi:hypothetical protein